MRNYSALLAGVALTLVLAACQPAAPDAPEAVRPVLTKTLALESAGEDRFAGVVAARYESGLGFRIFGRVISRSVSVGDLVTAGQQIAQMDATQQELNVRSAQANLASAQAQLENLVAIEQRQLALLENDNVSPAVFESAQQARRAGDSSLAQAQAQFDKAQEQLGYTTLRAESDGLVTAVSVEPGQTVSAGDVVATIVQPEVREAVISVLESNARDVQTGDTFTITKLLDPSQSVVGTVREVAPQAAAATRTVTVKISMDDPTGMFRLGSTIVATRVDPEGQVLVVPATSLLIDGAETQVWVVDGGTVSKRTVVAEQRESGDFIVRDGLAVGDVVVTAGVNSLTEGQQVGSSEGHAN
jgi:membrane fusion protein, multidrug efflux system